MEEVTEEEQVERLQENVKSLITQLDVAYESQEEKKGIGGEIQILECVGQTDQMRLLIFAEAYQTAMNVLKEAVGEGNDNYKVNCRWDEDHEARLMFFIKRDDVKK